MDAQDLHQDDSEGAKGLRSDIGSEQRLEGCCVTQTLYYVELFDLHIGVLWGFEPKLISKDHLCVSGRRGMPLYEDDLGNDSECVATKGLQYVLIISNWNSQGYPARPWRS